jgi:hypothetical protein
MYMTTENERRTKGTGPATLAEGDAFIFASVHQVQEFATSALNCTRPILGAIPQKQTPAFRADSGPGASEEPSSGQIGPQSHHPTAPVASSSPIPSRKQLPKLVYPSHFPKIVFPSHSVALLAEIQQNLKDTFRYMRRTRGVLPAPQS